jgi:aspartyl-tRNA(Asn)/glutamyl-tRNA(Gln) amidotransferase subunit A
MSEWTIATLATAIRARRISPVEATQECLSRIERLDGRLRAFITVDATGALARARALERDGAAGRWHGPLHGVPLAHKDLFRIAPLPTSCGTKTAEYFVSEGDATAVTRLAEAGAITLGKLNMAELAMGPYGDNAHHGDVQNPWRLGHVSGGSSSGSGAAVAAGLALGALGTDTGGSIRLPAACCGVAGLKPTYGRVSRAGAMALSWSMDHIGPMARTVRDVALMLEVIAGEDPADATASARPVDAYLARLERPIRGLRVAMVDNYYFDGVAPEVTRAVHAMGGTFERLGARVDPLRLPDPQVIHDVSGVVARAESAVVHTRILRERPHELQPAVRARLEVGERITAHDYLQALRLRARLAREFIAEVFAETDLVLAPVTPTPAPSLAEATAGDGETVAARMNRFSRLTRPWNGLGLPVLALPCGVAEDDLPIGAQLVGRPFDEATVLRAGHAYEQATEWHRRRPVLG